MTHVLQTYMVAFRQLAADTHITTLRRPRVCVPPDITKSVCRVSSFSSYTGLLLTLELVKFLAKPTENYLGSNSTYANIMWGVQCIFPRLVLF
jgi:hypothetical protein